MNIKAQRRFSSSLSCWQYESNRAKNPYLLAYLYNWSPVVHLSITDDLLQSKLRYCLDCGILIDFMSSIAFAQILIALSTVFSTAITSRSVSSWSLPRKVTPTSVILKEIVLGLVRILWHPTLWRQRIDLPIFKYIFGNADTCSLYVYWRYFNKKSVVYDR